MKTVESLSQTPERPGISLQDFGIGKKGHRIGVIGMERVLSAAFAEIQEKNNPYISIVKLYQLFAEQLPNISTESQRQVAQAIDSEVGIKVFILLNMKPIVSAAKPFLTGEPDADSDLIQAGITNLLKGIQRPRTNNQINNTYSYVYSLVQIGIAQEITARESLPVIPISDLKPDTSPVVGEKELIDAAFQPEVEEAVDIALRGLNEQEQKIIRARFGFCGKEYTLEEAGKLINRTKERARQIKAKGLRKLKHPMYSHKLKLCFFPERFGVIPRKKLPQPKYNFIDTEALATGNPTAPVIRLTSRHLVDPISFEYRYPFVRLGLYQTYYRPIIGIWQGLGLKADITAQLEKNKIRDLAQLLTRSDGDLEEIEFTPEQIQQIRSRVIEFLKEDARVVTK